MMTHISKMCMLQIINEQQKTQWGINNRIKMIMNNNFFHEIQKNIKIHNLLNLFNLNYRYKINGY
jgi:hypothetical protein